MVIGPVAVLHTIVTDKFVFIVVGFYFNEVSFLLCLKQLQVLFKKHGSSQILCILPPHSFLCALSSYCHHILECSCAPPERQPCSFISPSSFLTLNVPGPHTPRHTTGPALCTFYFGARCGEKGAFS